MALISVIIMLRGWAPGSWCVQPGPSLGQDVNLQRTVSPILKGFIKRHVVHLELAFLFRDTNTRAPKSYWRNLSLTRAEDPQVFCHIKKEGFCLLLFCFVLKKRTHSGIK